MFLQFNNKNRHCNYYENQYKCCIFAALFDKKDNVRGREVPSFYTEKCLEIQ